MAVTINVQSGSFKGEHQDDCPACGHRGVSMWAEDGEADLADYWQCVPGLGGCGASGAILKEGSTTLTQNGIPVGAYVVVQDLLATEGEEQFGFVVDIRNYEAAGLFDTSGRWFDDKAKAEEVAQHVADLLILGDIQHEPRTV